MTTLAAPYGLARPTVADLRTCIVNADPQLWPELCQIAHVDDDTDDPAAVGPLVAAALKATTGALKVSVASLNIRLRAHSALTAL